jgi:DNA-binding XRE family transcriptional regulator
MGVLEIIAMKRLGAGEFAAYPALRVSLGRAEKAARQPMPNDAQKERIAAIDELLFEYERESDSDEKANILRTLEEISANELLEMPTMTLGSWENQLKTSNTAYAKADHEANRRSKIFLKKYFSLRAKAGLATQGAVAKKTGLRRSYVSIIESGAHVPQQKTLQKLARAFKVDVSELVA